MNLKESYRYANYLDTLLNTAYRYLQNKGFVTTTKQNHLRSKVNSEATDEVIDIQKPYDVDFTPNDVIEFIINIINEKEKLFDAITNAKIGSEINIDNAVAINKMKHGFVSVLNNIVGIKSSETTTTGKAYKFDINGEQKPYIYEICQTTSIDYNRTNIRNLIKKYLKETDDISTKLDFIEINTKVEFDPSFDVNTSFEDSITEYTERKD